MISFMAHTLRCFTGNVVRRRKIISNWEHWNQVFPLKCRRLFYGHVCTRMRLSQSCLLFWWVSEWGKLFILCFFWECRYSEGVPHHPSSVCLYKRSAFIEWKLSLPFVERLFWNFKKWDCFFLILCNVLLVCCHSFLLLFSTDVEGEWLLRCYTPVLLCEGWFYEINCIFRSSFFVSSSSHLQILRSSVTMLRREIG